MRAISWRALPGQPLTGLSWPGPWPAQSWAMTRTARARSITSPNLRCSPGCLHRFAQQDIEEKGAWSRSAYQLSRRRQCVAQKGREERAGCLHRRRPRARGRRCGVPVAHNLREVQARKREPPPKPRHPQHRGRFRHPARSKSRWSLHTSPMATNETGGGHFARYLLTFLALSAVPRGAI